MKITICRAKRRKRMPPVCQRRKDATCNRDDLGRNDLGKVVAAENAAERGDHIAAGGSEND